MARPGGWNKNGLEFNDTGNELRFFVLGRNQGAEELPIGALTPQHPSHSTKVKEATIQLLESRDVLNPGKDLAVGIRATQAFVETTCQQWGIPAEFLRKVRKPGSLPWFSHRVAEDTSNGTTPPKMKALNVCFRWGQGHSSYIVMFGRYDAQSSTLKVFLSSRAVAEDVRVLELFSAHTCILRKHPLQLLGILMGMCERYVDMRVERQNTENLEVGGMLAVQATDWLKSWHIEVCRAPNKSQVIYAAYDMTNWLDKSCKELISIGKQYLTLAVHLEAQYRVIIPTEEVQDVVHRAELHSHMLQYIKRMVRSQFDSYNNLLAREESKHSAVISEASAGIAEASYRDSLSMKTISYLTMVFFPITFVSAIFSTSIFDFQQWDATAANSGVISPGWWVFVLSCGLVTVLTLAVWRFWQALAERQKKLDRLRSSDLEKGSEESTAF